MVTLPINPFRYMKKCLPALALAVFSTIAFAQSTPNDFDSLAAQAGEAREQNNIPAAVELYSEALQRKPDWAEGLWFLGSLRYTTGAYAPARDALTRFIALNPNAGPALALRGLCEFETADYPQALADIQHAAALGAGNQPRNERILRYHEALLLTRTGRFEDALNAFAFFAHDEAPDPELFLAIGLAGLRTPLLPKEVPTDRQELFTTAGKAALHFLAGDDNAGQAFQDLFQRFPSAANAHYLYGYLLFGKEPEQSFTEFKRELEVSPSNAAAHVMVAWDSLLRSDPSDALVHIEKAVQEDPSVRGEQMILGRCLMETGNLKDGIEHLEQALRLEPNNLEVHLALAKAYSKSGRKDDARRERLASLKLTEKDVSSVEHP
jgi:tetratricopeptide (TPR) repeat protein